MGKTSGEKSNLCLPNNGTYPWLVYPHGKGEKNRIFCSISRPYNCQNRNIPALRGKTILSCCFGWVLLLSEGNHPFQFSLWNPLSSKSIHFPPLPLEANNVVDHAILSSPPMTPDSMVFLFVGNYPSLIVCQVIDKYWTVVTYGEKLREIGVGDTNYGVLEYPVFCDGKIYAITYRGGYHKCLMIRMDESDDLVIESYDVEEPDFYSNSPKFRRHIVESCGALFLVYIILGGIRYNEVVDIEVHKLDFTERDWHKVTSAKDQLFFLDGYYASSCTAMKSETESSRVYFTLFKDKSLYSFNIEDGSLSVTLPCSKLPTPWSSPQWIMPDPRFTGVEVESMNLTQLVEKSRSLEIIQDSVETVEDDNALIPFCRLPSDVLSLISSYLVLVDYINFRAVCRTSQSVAPPIQWRSVLPKLKSSNLSPWLMFPENNKDIHHFVDSKFGGRYLMRVPDPLVGARIQCSNNGRLLMSKEEDMFLYNPFTTNTIRLPSAHRACSSSDSLIVSSSESLAWLVVGLTSYAKNLYIYVTWSGEDQWYQYHLESSLDFNTNNNTPALYNEAHYFLGRDGNLAVFEFRENNPSWKVLESPQRPCKSFHHNYLLECGGDLLSVFVGQMGRWVKVFRLNNASMDWEPVKNLGDYVLFVNRKSSFSAVAMRPEMRNKIYFPRFWDENIMLYSLDDEKLHTFGSQETIPDFYNSTEALSSCWLHPTW